jgi:hypothetical protein
MTMTGKDIIRFRDSVAADVAGQYPQLDYLDAVIARTIERRITLLGWHWLGLEGPTRIKEGEQE